MHAHFSAKITCSHLGLAYISKFLVDLLPAWKKKPAVNIKEIPWNARIKFSIFCEISYFLSIFVIMMI